MSNPKVSIIIPVYNGSDFLREALDSALNQTYKNIEVIVINDGSDDDDATRDIALSYGKQIRYYEKVNGGVASALNLGIKKMKGDYFSWLSHDDLYYPNKIEYFLNYLNEIGDMKRIVFSSYDIFIHETKQRIGFTAPLEYDRRDIENATFSVFAGIVHGCTLLIHKSHFDRVGNFNELLRTSQDYDMWFRMFRYQNISYLDKPFVQYRIHKNQGSKSIPEFFSNCETLYLDMMNRITKNEIEETFGGTYQFYYHMMNFFYKNHWKLCYEYARNHFFNETEKDDIKKKRIQFSNTLLGEVSKKICLFCAGKNAIQLNIELDLRGVEVIYLSDNDPNKYGTEIGGVMCIPISEIDKKDTLIIVTKDNPEEVKAELVCEGFEHVTTYDKIRRLIYECIPVKERCKSYFPAGQ